MSTFEKTFCVLPFTHLATHPSGDVTPCCESRLNSTTEGKHLNLNFDSIEDIRNSDSSKQLREDMLNGTQNPACNFCYKREQEGLESKRIRENRRWGITEQNYLDYVHSPLEYVELRLGNICNLKCSICHPWSSSKWNEDADAVGYEKLHLDRTWFKDNSFYKNLAKHSQTIKHLWFNGGEPTLIKEHYYILEELIDSGKSHEVTLEYHTNGTSLPKKLLKLWESFKSVRVTFSIDDVGDRLYYQRYPSNSKEVVKNIIKLKEYSTITSFIAVIPTINLYNIHNLDNIYNFYSNEIGVNVNLINYLHFPDNLAIYNLPEDRKKELFNSLSKSLPEYCIKELEYNFFKKHSQGLEKFINFTKSLDSHRNISILDYLPEYAEYF